MTDQADTSERKPKAAGGKTLSLKRTVESGHVRQNFSHGRSKSVVVEKKKKRTLKTDGAATAPAEEKAKPAAPAAKEAP
ncbi:MAG: translation initiation factor IF-2 associated domain-containing protein, partial [Pseudomonadota bacterium]